MRIGAFPEREEILIQVAGFPQERVPLNTHSKFRRSFQTKGNLWCREGDFLGTDFHSKCYQQDAVFCVT